MSIFLTYLHVESTGKEEIGEGEVGGQFHEENISPFISCSQKYTFSFIKKHRTLYRSLF